MGTPFAFETIIRHFGEYTEAREITSRQLVVFFAALHKNSFLKQLKRFSESPKSVLNPWSGKAS
jgi:hypothetical protein